MGLSISLPQPSQFGNWQEWAENVNQVLANALLQVPDQTIGALVLYVGALPQGILPCNGTTFKQITYPALYRQLGGGTLPNIAPVGGFSYGIKAL